MKPFALLFGAALLVSPVVAESQAAGNAMHANHGAATQPASMSVPKWMEPLNLTAEQRKAVAGIHHEAHGKMDAAKKSWTAQGKSMDKDPALKAEMQRMMDAEHAAFRAALAPAQHAAYDAALKAHMGEEHGAAKSCCSNMKDGMKHDGMKHDGMKHDAPKSAEPKKP
jgi:hypothetical protein